MSRAYGDTLGEYFGANKAPLIVRSGALDNHVAATYLHSEHGTGLTDPIPAEPALLIAVQLKPLIQHELWIDGRKQASPTYATGAVTLVDLQSLPVANLMMAYECVQMYFPRDALDHVCEAEDLPFIRDVPMLLGAEDPMLAALGRLAAFAVSPVGAGSAILLETMLVGACRHVNMQYAGTKKEPANARKVLRLAAAQERQVKEFIDAFIDTNISLTTLAALCSMRPSTFGRAFKNTVGVSPQRWLISRRLSRARQYLMFTDMSLSAIAISCGFHDQAHLSRVFRIAEGVAPGAWRRVRRT